MHRSRRPIAPVSIVRRGRLAMLLLALATFPASGAAAQGVAPAQQRDKTVGEAFKNIRVLTDLKDSPMIDLYNTMQFISGSLSVTCNYCHVSQQGPFESDAKKTKLKAREMITMMRAINDNNFGGRVVVTCNTCHRGSPRPVGTPVPWYKTDAQIDSYLKAVASAASDSGRALPPAVRGAAAGAALPSVAQVMERYRRAVGAGPVASMHVAGTFAQMTSSRARDVTVVFPDKILLVGPGGRQIVNGDRGWQVTAQGTTSLIAPVVGLLKDTFGAGLAPVKYDTAGAPRTVTGVDTIGDHAYYVVESRPGAAIQRLFFDVQSGLLLKVQTSARTPLGTKVEETTFEDYRAVSGVTLPYLITNHFMEDRWVFRISAIQVNVALDPTTFDPPPASP